MASRLLASVFWWSVGETAAGYGAAGVSTVLLLHAGQVLTDVPWYAVFSGGVIGALVGVCKAFTSLVVQPDNGNSSWLARVVAAPKADDVRS
jgi:hypothetical protein